MGLEDQRAGSQTGWAAGEVSDSRLGHPFIMTNKEAPAARGKPTSHRGVSNVIKGGGGSGIWRQAVGISLPTSRQEGETKRALCWLRRRLFPAEAKPGPPQRSPGRRPAHSPWPFVPKKETGYWGGTSRMAGPEGQARWTAHATSEGGGAGSEGVGFS